MSALAHITISCDLFTFPWNKNVVRQSSLYELFAPMHLHINHPAPTTTSYSFRKYARTAATHLRLNHAACTLWGCTTKTKVILPASPPATAHRCSLSHLRLMQAMTSLRRFFPVHKIKSNFYASINSEYFFVNKYIISAPSSSSILAKLENVTKKKGRTKKSEINWKLEPPIASRRLSEKIHQKLWYNVLALSWYAASTSAKNNKSNSVLGRAQNQK